MKLSTGLLLINVLVVGSFGVRTKIYSLDENESMKKLLQQHFKDDYFGTLYDKLHPKMGQIRHANLEWNKDFLTKENEVDNFMSGSDNDFLSVSNVELEALPETIAVPNSQEMSSQDSSTIQGFSKLGNENEENDAVKSSETFVFDEPLYDSADKYDFKDDATFETIGDVPEPDISPDDTSEFWGGENSRSIGNQLPGDLQNEGQDLINSMWKSVFEEPLPASEISNLDNGNEEEEDLITASDFITSLDEPHKDYHDNYDFWDDQTTLATAENTPDDTEHFWNDNLSFQIDNQLERRLVEVQVLSNEEWQIDENELSSNSFDEAFEITDQREMSSELPQVRNSKTLESQLRSNPLTSDHKEVETDYDLEPEVELLFDHEVLDPRPQTSSFFAKLEPENKPAIPNKNLNGVKDRNHSPRVRCPPTRLTKYGSSIEC